MRFHRIRDRMSRSIFNFAARSVLETPPLHTAGEHGVRLFTQLQHKDVLMSVLAMKSLARRLQVKGVAVLNDGSLTAADRALLDHHLAKPEFFELKDFRSDQCPTGGTWERLLAIAELSRREYVIQVDADTLTLGAVDEVARCVAAHRSFAIGTWDGQEIEPMTFRASEARRHLTARPHVQPLSEAHFDKLSRGLELRYVRGCSGFAGFAANSVDRRFIEEISSEMFGLIGKRWSEWGSEQVMSNIVVANAPESTVLPHPKFCDCSRIREGVTEFIHFIGSCRFDRGLYSSLARRVAQDLMESPTQQAG